MINPFDLLNDTRTPEEKRLDEYKGRMVVLISLVLLIAALIIFGVGLYHVWFWFRAML